MSTALINQLLAQRTSPVEVAPGKALLVRRPAEAQMGRFRAMTPDLLVEHVVGWQGFTEADLLGAGIGGSSEAVYSPELAAVALPDHLEWLDKVSTHLVATIKAHLDKKAAASKN